jgi:acyl carrier protein
MIARNTSTVTQSQVSTWIADYIAKTLDMPSAEVDRAMDLENLGLNSALVVSMIGDLEDWLGVELSPAIVFEYRTIDAIASYLADEMAAQPSVAADAAAQ